MPKRFGYHGANPAVEGEFQALWQEVDGLVRCEARLRQDEKGLPGATRSEKKAREQTADLGGGGESFLLMGA
jgi:hypothetical protein